MTEEFALALKEGGVQAFERMYDNGKKHIFNDGEYRFGLKDPEASRNPSIRKAEEFSYSTATTVATNVLYKPKKDVYARCR